MKTVSILEHCYIYKGFMSFFPPSSCCFTSNSFDSACALGFYFGSKKNSHDRHETMLNSDRKDFGREGYFRKKEAIPVVL